MFDLVALALLIARIRLGRATWWQLKRVVGQAHWTQAPLHLKQATWWTL